MGAQEKLQEMQLIEQSLNNLLMQKQAFEMEHAETKAALAEVESADDDVYKIVGHLMLKTSKEKTTTELTQKEKLLDLRLKSFEKQEKTFSEKLEALRNEVLKDKKK